MSSELSHSDIENALLAAIHRFFEERAAQESEGLGGSEPIDARPLQLATAILFLQMIAADHESRHDEHQALVGAITRVLRVDAESAAVIIRFAEDQVRTPLPELIRLLNSRCSVNQKKDVVQSLWQLAFADAELVKHEEYFVRKVSEVLGLSMADLVETKIRAREAFLAGD